MIDYIYTELTKISALDMPGSTWHRIDNLLQAIEYSIKHRYMEDDYGRSTEGTEKEKDASDTAVPQLYQPCPSCSVQQRDGETA